MRVSAIVTLLDNAGHYGDCLSFTYVDGVKQSCSCGHGAAFLELEEAEKRERETLNVLGLTTAILTQCYLYKGYSDGPAQQLGVRTILRRAEDVLTRGEQCE